MHGLHGKLHGALAVEGGVGQNFYAGGAEGTIFVPEGRRFILVAEGQDEERCAVRVESPDGTELWAEDRISGQTPWVSPKDVAGGMWTLKTSRPSVGKFEDHTIAIRGVQPVIFLNRGRYWQPLAATDAVVIY